MSRTSFVLITAAAILIGIATVPVAAQTTSTSNKIRANRPSSLGERARANEARKKHKKKRKAPRKSYSGDGRNISW